MVGKKNPNQLTSPQLRFNVYLKLIEVFLKELEQKKHILCILLILSFLRPEEVSFLIDRVVMKGFRCVKIWQHFKFILALS